MGLGPANAPDGELKICVTAMNPTPLLQEYAVELRAANGKRIDREPERALAVDENRDGQPSAAVAADIGEARLRLLGRGRPGPRPQHRQTQCRRSPCDLHDAIFHPVKVGNWHGF